MSTSLDGYTMKILVIGNEAEQFGITNFSKMQSYHFIKNLRNNGAIIDFFSPQYEDIWVWAEELLEHAKGYDCILALGVRFLTHIPVDVCLYLRKNFNGIVAQTYDGTLLDSPHADLTLTARNYLLETENVYQNINDRLERHFAHNAYIGWAADHTLFKPNKNKEILNIFVDHANFCSNYDYTLNVIMNLKNIPIPFKARTLTQNGLIDIDVNNIKLPMYMRKSIPSEDFAAELNKADIFIATHPESLGQTIIEAAMAGCFILVPPKCISKDRLLCVDHIVFDENIDWNLVLKNISPEEHRKKALKHTWDMVAKRAIVALNDFIKPEVKIQ